jgi:hypothetical protein
MFSCFFNNLIVSMVMLFLFIITAFFVVVVFLVSLARKELDSYVQYGFAVLAAITVIWLCTLLLFEPSKQIERMYVTKRAETIIKYLEDEKKDKGAYPAVDVNTIIVPGSLGVDRFHYICKSNQEVCGEFITKERLAQETDFYELSFFQSAGLLDSYVSVYRPDNDYSRYPDAKDGPNGWKFFLKRF